MSSAEEPARDRHGESFAEPLSADLLEDLEEDLHLGVPGAWMEVDDLGEEGFGLTAKLEELLALEVETGALAETAASMDVRCSEKKLTEPVWG